MVMVWPAGHGAAQSASGGSARVKLPTLPNLDGLIGLAHQDGVDVRPTLVRVLTDLYVQKRTHTADEEHRYTELALWLLAAVDVPTRAAVAKKLATCADAPRLVVRRLARDAFEVAEPVLRQSTRLTGDDLLAVIKDFGPRYAAVIATRGSTDAAVAAGSAEPVADRPAAAACGAERKVPALLCSEAPNDAEPADNRADQRAGTNATAVELGEYFFSAGSSERRLLLANLADGAPTPSETALATAADDAILRLEAAALQRRPDVFVRELERTLKIPGRAAERIVHDDTGEPIVVAAKALGMQWNILLRILLFLNPAIGQSVERVFDLVDLYDQLAPEAALHVVSSWRNKDASDRRMARYQPVHWDDETRGARRHFADHPRRFPVQVPDGRSLPGRIGERSPSRRHQGTT
jgi:hypothetical protein